MPLNEQTRLILLDRLSTYRPQRPLSYMDLETQFPQQLTSIIDVIFHPNCHPNASIIVSYSLESKCMTLVCGACHEFVLKVRVDDLQEEVKD